ncbi:MAG: hypothetical protein ACLUW6_06035 [Coriobacteriaceae bacterium]
MNIASVIVDIPTQALDTPYSYAVPDEMLVGEGGRPAAVGCAVLVTLGGRKAVGYIVGLEEVVPPRMRAPTCGDAPVGGRLKQVEAVLSAPFFDEEGRPALWLADRYSRRWLSACVVAPPRAVPLSCQAATGAGASRSRPSARSTIAGSRGPAFDAFVPKNAVKRQEVLAAVDAGDVRVAELSGVRHRGSTLTLAAKGAVVVERRRRMRGMEDGALARGARPAGSCPAPLRPPAHRGQKAAVAAIEAARAAAGVWCSWTASLVPARPRCTCGHRAHARRGHRAIVLVRKSRSPQTVAHFRGRFGDAVPSCTPA